MNYEIFFWTRGESIDYRFQIIPKLLEQEERNELLSFLQYIYKDLGNQKQLIESLKIDAIYTLTLKNNLVLIKYRPSPNRLDQSTNTVWEAVGVITNKINEKEFKREFPSFIYNDFLWNLSKEYGFPLSEETKQSPNFSITNGEEIDLSIWDKFKASYYSILREIPEVNEITIFVPFSVEGNDLLKHILIIHELPWITTAFGPHSVHFFNTLNKFAIQCTSDISEVLIVNGRTYSPQEKELISSSSEKIGSLLKRRGWFK
jgi:hypothetical protein